MQLQLISINYLQHFDSVDWIGDMNGIRLAKKSPKVSLGGQA